ncbi:hypothetical protein TSMEX_003812, partial [Taenia solium]
ATSVVLFEKHSIRSNTLAVVGANTSTLASGWIYRHLGDFQLNYPMLNELVTAIFWEIDVVNKRNVEDVMVVEVLTGTGTLIDCRSVDVWKSPMNPLDTPLQVRLSDGIVKRTQLGRGKRSRSARRIAHPLVRLSLPANSSMAGTGNGFSNKKNKLTGSVKLCEAASWLVSPVCPRLRRAAPPDRLSVPPVARLGGHARARAGTRPLPGLEFALPPP